MTNLVTSDLIYSDIQANKFALSQIGPEYSKFSDRIADFKYANFKDGLLIPDPSETLNLEKLKEIWLSKDENHFDIKD